MGCRRRSAEHLLLGAEANDSASHQQVINGALMRKRVLIVNDSDAVLHTVGLVLRQAGYEVELANRPETALAKAPGANVMLCDSVVAEDKNGSIALQAVRRNKGLRVLMWIGAGEQPRGVIERNFGAFWKLPKPIDPTLLLQHLGSPFLPSR